MISSQKKNFLFCFFLFFNTHNILIGMNNNYQYPKNKYLKNKYLKNKYSGIDFFQSFVNNNELLKTLEKNINDLQKISLDNETTIQQEFASPYSKKFKQSLINFAQNIITALSNFNTTCLYLKKIYRQEKIDSQGNIYVNGIFEVDPNKLLYLTNNLSDKINACEKNINYINYLSNTSKNASKTQFDPRDQIIKQNIQVCYQRLETTKILLEHFFGKIRKIKNQTTNENNNFIFYNQAVNVIVESLYFNGEINNVSRFIPVQNITMQNITDKKINILNKFDQAFLYLFFQSNPQY